MRAARCSCSSSVSTRCSRCHRRRRKYRNHLCKHKERYRQRVDRRRTDRRRRARRSEMGSPTEKVPCESVNEAMPRCTQQSFTRLVQRRPRRTNSVDSIACSSKSVRTTSSWDCRPDVDGKPLLRRRESGSDCCVQRGDDTCRSIGHIDGVADVRPRARS